MPRKRKAHDLWCGLNESHRGRCRKLAPRIMFVDRAAEPNALLLRFDREIEELDLVILYYLLRDTAR